ncbi:MAG: hypothetical protein ACRDNJ_07455 [Solirubrobacteraceae bacterium]
MPEPNRVLIVAHQTVKTDRLLEAVRARAQQGQARFHLLVPRLAPHGKHRLIDDVGLDDDESGRVLEEALPLLSEAAGSEVTGSLGVPGAISAIQAEVERDPYDEIIISTLPPRISRWLKTDVVSKARSLGLPVTHVQAVEAPMGHARPAAAGSDRATGGEPAQVLVVAHQTAVTERLLEAVRRRAEHGSARFHLIVPRMPQGGDETIDSEQAGEEARHVLEEALPRLSEAAGREVSGSLGDAEPLMAIRDALSFGQYDEIMISTLPPRISRWLRLDLVSKARGLGLPVTHVESVEALTPV